MKDFSESINQRFKGRQIPEEQVKSINTNLEELAKEVQGVKPEREEQIDYLEINIESKTVSDKKNTKCSTRRSRNCSIITPLFHLAN